MCRTFGSSSRGDASYAVFFDGSCAKFYDCSFQYATIAGFYAMYGQYNEFWSCMFGACAATASSAGCLLDSHSAGASSNEVLFSRCKFFVCSTFLTLKGCFLTRIRDCTFQGAPATGMGGLILDSDSTGQGSVGTVIDSCWFEDNQVPHIRGLICQSTRIQNNSFYPSVGASSRIQFDYCYDLEVVDNISYGETSCRVAHAPGDTLTASLSWHGNNFVPALALDHAGPSLVDLQSAAARLRRNDNMLLSTGQQGIAGLPLLQTDQYGFKTGLARSITTPLFAILLEPFAAVAHAPVLVLEIRLFSWQDSADPQAYASCSSIQSAHAFITNHGGTLAVFLTGLQPNSELGVNLDSRSLGRVFLSAAVTGSLASGTGTVTFSAAFSGAGSNASSGMSATVGYHLFAMGGNPFRMQRL